MAHETFADAWSRRYGTSAPTAIPAIEPFLRHRSVRAFTADPVPEDTVRALIAAAQSASTSSNLQLWSAISVQDPARRAAIAKLCGDQPQITACAWFFAFIADHARLEQAAQAVGEKAAGLSTTEFFTMAIADAALAAERMACAAEAIGLGVCYIGALRNDPPGVAALLQLPPRTFGVFGFCLGVPKADAGEQIKPRLAQESIWFRETYSQPDLAEYDARMSAWYASQGAKPGVNWSMRSARRADGSPAQMGGREKQLGFLKSQGFLAE